MERFVPCAFSWVDPGKGLEFSEAPLDGRLLKAAWVDQVKASDR
jgi:hypothetical protein